MKLIYTAGPYRAATPYDVAVTLHPLGNDSAGNDGAGHDGTRAGEAICQLSLRPLVSRPSHPTG